MRIRRGRRHIYRLYLRVQTQVHGLHGQFASHILCAAVGLIPNCASSVALTQLAISGVISAGAMMSGLFAGAGVGVLILFRMNKRPRENVLIVGLLLTIGVIFGIFADLFGIALI